MVLVRVQLFLTGARYGTSYDTILAEVTGEKLVEWGFPPPPPPGPSWTGLKDLSNMLAVVSAVQTRNIIKHIQAERKMLIVAFVHINSVISQKITCSLFKYEFGVTSLVGTFSAIHGDLVTEHFNK